MSEPTPATTLRKVSKLTRQSLVFGPTHPFYCPFDDVRSDRYEINLVYSTLGISKDAKGHLVCDDDEPNDENCIIYLFGHRGSGKSTELLRYKNDLNRPAAFFCIHFSLLDQGRGLDLGDVDIADVLIYMAEQLVARLDEARVDNMNPHIVEELFGWYAETEKQVIKSGKAEGAVEVGADVKAGIPGLFQLITKVRAKAIGAAETRKVTRTTFKNRFTQYIAHFNAFLAEAVKAVRAKKLGRDVLFIVDDLEKITDLSAQRSLLIDGSGYLSKLLANIVMALPIEMIHDAGMLENYCRLIVPLPMVKLKDKGGNVLVKAKERMRKFLLLRVNEQLFDNRELIDQMVLFSGGSPRLLMRITDQAAAYATGKQITETDVHNAVRSLGRMANQLDEEAWAVLKALHQANTQNKPTPSTNEAMKHLLANSVVFEYNDGSYRQVSPIIENHPTYQQNAATWTS